MKKHYLGINVYEAARARIRLVFEHFEQVCVAFSGGKDSSVTFHLALEVAREMGRLPVQAVFIDLEGQYQATIDHVTEMFDRDDVQPWWICLPINLRNASSVHEPFWCAWEPGREDDWTRPLPQHSSVISDPDYFPFYRYRMEFEDFAPAFNDWLAREKSTAILVGIRAAESLNRYLAVKGGAKKSAWTVPDTGERIAWSSKCRPASQANLFFPIYDWRFEDLWRYTSERGLAYNRIYDAMYRLRIPFSKMRLCQPFGDDQRKGLDQFHRLEPQTWFRLVNRVAGANFAARYCGQRALGYRGGLGIPPAFSSWRQYSQFLLSSLPDTLRVVYMSRISRFAEWWAERGYPLDSWPDAGEPALENRRTQPSWRRVALSLLKQDMARSLSFGAIRPNLKRPQR